MTAVIVAAAALAVGGVIGLAVGCLVSAHAINARDERIAALVHQIDQRDLALRAATGKDQ